MQEAANGREALARLQQDKPDLILLDLMMPEMDGFAVVAALQKEPAGATFPSSSSPRSISAQRIASDSIPASRSVLVKDTFRPTELVERIRRLVQVKPAANAAWKQRRDRNVSQRQVARP